MSSPPPTQLLFVTHPATAQQRAGIFPADEPLDERALRALAGVKWRPSSGARILAAPEQRTEQTAAALASNHTPESALRECDFASWRGRSFDQLQAGQPEELRKWLTDIDATPHQGESFSALIVRVANWLEAQRVAGPAVVFTHATIVRAAVLSALGSTPQRSFYALEIGPLTLTDLRLSGGHWRVRSVAVPLA